MDQASSLKYEQVAEYLREQIRSGAWKVGDRLPSHVEARAQFSCTQNTIERAHALLEKDGLIERRHRLGTFVAASSPRKARPHEDGQTLTGKTWASETIAVCAFSGHNGLIMADSGWESSIVQGALNAAQDADMHALLLHPSRLQPNKVAGIQEHPPAGIFLSLSGFTQEQAEESLRGLQSINVPAVAYGSLTQFANYDCVVSDHEAGARKLTRYLISRGCKRILNMQFVEKRVLTYWQPDRQAGYENAMKEAGLTALPAFLVEKTPDGKQDAEDIEFFKNVARLVTLLQPHLTGKNKCDALMVESDGLVAYVAAACRLMEVEPNRDVLIAGYDNYWENMLKGRVFDSTAPVATVDKNNMAIGAAGVQLLVERINGRLSQTPQRRIVEPELVVTVENDSEPTNRYETLLASPAGKNLVMSLA